MTDATQTTSNASSSAPAAAGPRVELAGLDLAALLCSKVCHDVISPVGAIVNGLEILEDEDDESMRETALGLVAKSARQASARLQFARIAFGAAGSAGASIDTGDAADVARAFFADDGKVKLTWTGARLLLPKNKVKLLLNLIMIGASAIPRGGQITASISGGVLPGGEDVVLTVAAEGLSARVPNGLKDLLAGHPPSGTVDAHGIQPFYAGEIARAAGMTLDVSIEGERVTLLARPADAA